MSIGFLTKGPPLARTCAVVVLRHQARNSNRCTVFALSAHPKCMVTVHLAGARAAAFQALNSAASFEITFAACNSLLSLMESSPRLELLTAFRLPAVIQVTALCYFNGCQSNLVSHCSLALCEYHHVGIFSGVPVFIRLISGLPAAISIESDCNAFPVLEISALRSGCCCVLI